MRGEEQCFPVLVLIAFAPAGFALVPVSAVGFPCSFRPAVRKKVMMLLSVSGEHDAVSLAASALKNPCVDGGGDIG